MPPMPEHESFEVEVGPRKVHGIVWQPEEGAFEPPWPAVMLCRGIPGQRDYARDLFGELTTALGDAGFVVSQFESRPMTDDPAAIVDYDAAQHVDEASAVFRMLALRPDLDLHRIGVIGYALGAMIAACLARRSDQIARLCLVAPTTGDELTARVNKSGDAAAGLDVDQMPHQVLDTLAELRPTDDIAAYDRPTLIVHGAIDQVIPPDDSLPYADAIEQAGHEVQRVLVALGDHEFTSPPARLACLDQIIGFFSALAVATPARK